MDKKYFFTLSMYNHLHSKATMHKHSQLYNNCLCATNHSKYIEIIQIRRHRFNNMKKPLQIFVNTLDACPSKSKKIEFLYKKVAYSGELCLQDGEVFIRDHRNDPGTFLSFSGWAKSISKKPNSGWDNCYMDGKRMAQWRDELCGGTSKKRKKTTLETKKPTKRRKTGHVNFEKNVDMVVYERDTAPKDLVLNITLHPLKSEKKKKAKTGISTTQPEEQKANDAANDQDQETIENEKQPEHVDENEKQPEHVDENEKQPEHVDENEKQAESETETQNEEEQTGSEEECDEAEEEDKPRWLTDAQFNKILDFIFKHGAVWNHFEMPTCVMKSIVVQLAMHMNFLVKDGSFRSKVSMYIDGIVAKCKWKFTFHPKVKEVFESLIDQTM